jgi:hypothetical protein
MVVDIETGRQAWYRWRLISTHITTVLNRDKTGFCWDENYDREEMESMCLRADWVVRHRAPLRSTGHCIERNWCFDHDETLFSSLSNDGVEINMIMKGSVYCVPSTG